MARPTVTGGRERQKQKKLYLTSQEVRKIDSLVRKNGETFSDYARRVLMDENKNTSVKVEQVVSREVMRELHAIGNNINQIAHNSNIHDAATREEIYQAAALVEDLALTLQPMRIKLSSQYTHCPTCKQKLDTRDT
ncbi:MAG: plasmid mobilization relaxosome protein MobC [Actinomycetaceae bacterium]|nr:plasmid mobilization relaxosome protein MobC [Actinomycetaceae bacterium]